MSDLIGVNETWSDVRAKINGSTVRSVLDNIPKQFHAAIKDGTTTLDASPYVQGILDNEEFVDFTPIKTGKLIFGSPVTLRGRKKLIGAFTRIVSGWEGSPGRGLFEDLDGDNFLRLEMSGFILRGPASGLVFRKTVDTLLGTAALISGVEFGDYADAYEAGTYGIDASQCDFLQVNKCIFINKEVGIRFSGNPGRPARGNTQIELLDNYYTQVGTSLYIEKCNLLNAQNQDTMTCGAGYVLGPTNTLINFKQCHVENLGAPGYAGITVSNGKFDSSTSTTSSFVTTGYGQCVVDGAANVRIRYEQCQVFNNNNAGALVGFYRGYDGLGGPQDVTYDDCYVVPTNSANAEYRPLEFHQQTAWEGNWQGFSTVAQNLRLGTVSDQYTDILINEGANNNRSGSRSLLPGIKAINLRSPEDGGATIAEDTEGIVQDGHLVSFAATAGIYESVYLAQGWYTMCVSGYKKTGTVQVLIRTDDANLFTRYRSGFDGGTVARTYRLPFYIATAGLHRIGLRASGPSSSVIGSLALYQGFFIGNRIEAGGWDAPPVLSLPTASARWRGKLLTLDKQGAADDEVYSCIRTSSGFSWKVVS